MKQLQLDGSGKSTTTKILHAALMLMADHGYKGTTTKMIAKAAGVNEGSIFRLFENKEGIMFALMADVEDEGRKDLESILYDTNMDLEQMLYSYAKAEYDGMVAKKEILLISVMDSEKRDGFASKVLEKWAWSAKLLEDKFVSLYQSGVIELADFSAMASLFNHGVFGVFISVNRFSVPTDTEKMFRCLAHMTHSALTQANKMKEGL